MAASYAHERHVAELATLRASILTKKVLASVSGISKADSSPVTIADFAAQALLISALHYAFPNDAFVGEEDSAALRSDAALREKVYELVSSADLAEFDEEGKLLPKPTSVEEMLDLIDLGGKGQGGGTGRFWVMDPIDGTAAFLKGEQYAVSLALVEDGREVVGVLGCPNLALDAGVVHESIVDKEGLGVMLTAVRGQGSTIRRMTPEGLQSPRQLPRLISPTDPKELHFVDCAQSKTSRHDIISSLAEHFNAQFPHTEVWSSHMRYAAVIVGGGDLQLRIPKTAATKMYIWDHAGAQLILTETRGKVTDLDGKEMDFGAGRDLARNRGLVAAKGDVHASVLEVLTNILEAEKKG